MTKSQLSNLSVLKAFINDKKNTLNSLLPFVEYVIAEFACEWIDFIDLKERIGTSCLLDIPSTTLRTLLKILKQNNFVTGYENWSKIQVVTSQKHATEEYQEKFQDANRETVALLQACKEYCGFTITDEEMSNTLYSFLNDYQQKIDISNGQIGVNNSESSEQPLQNHPMYQEIIAFIAEISSSDTKSYTTFKNIFGGFLLSQFIRHGDISERRTIANLSVYIDSNFILRILDLQAPPHVEASRELLNLMIEHNMSIRVLPEIIEEVKRSIEWQRIKYEKDKEYFGTIYGNNGDHKLDGIIGAFFRRNLQLTQIFDLIDNIDGELKTFGIIVQKQSLSFEKSNGWNEVEYQAIVRNKLSRAKIDIAASTLTQSQQFERNQIEIRAELDEAVLKFIRQQRNFSRKTRLDQCRVLFLTCDNTLYRANVYSHKQNGTIPECLNEISFTNTLYMHNPGLSPDSSIKSLIAIFQSSSYLDYDFLKKFHLGIAAHIDKEPDDKQYLSYIFLNLNMFNELLEQQDEDDVTPLVNSLVTEARIARETELATGKAAILENEKLLVSISELSKQLSTTQEITGALNKSQGEIADLKTRLEEKDRLLVESIAEHEKELQRQEEKEATRQKKWRKMHLEVFGVFFGALFYMH